MRLIVPLLVTVAASSTAWPIVAAAQSPQISRPVGTPQAVDVVHTLRAIPEACARIQGHFTGDDAKPYAFAVVKTDPRCQRRAGLVDAAKVSPRGKPGWVYVDLVRVPNASCASQEAVVRIWRQESNAAVPPPLDAQGRSRLYLEDALGARPPGGDRQPVFAVEMGVSGKGCY